MLLIPDVLRSVDYLFDAWNPQSDVHGGYASKVEGFQGHLSAWLTNALSTKSPDSGARLHLSSGWKIQNRVLKPNINNLTPVVFLSTFSMCAFQN